MSKSYSLAQSINTLNDNLAIGRSFVGVVPSAGAANITLDTLSTYIIITQITITGQQPTFAIASTIGAIYVLHEILSSSNIVIEYDGLVLTINNGSAGTANYFIYKLL